eukprot:14238633-Alexandrium_andersonii.AAC.1
MVVSVRSTRVAHEQMWHACECAWLRSASHIVAHVLQSTLYITIAYAAALHHLPFDRECHTLTVVAATVEATAISQNCCAIA